MPDSISLFMERPDAGGANRNLIHISKYLIEKNYTVNYILGSTDGAFYEKIPDGVNLIDLGSSNRLSTIWKLSKYISREKPDRIMSTTHVSITIAHLANLLSEYDGAEFIARQGTHLTEHTVNSDFRHSILFHLLKILFPMSDKVIAVSEGVKEDLVDSTRLSKSDIDVIYNPAIPSLSEVDELSNADPGHEWLTNKDHTVILGAGRLVKQKDFVTLLTAFSDVRETIDAKLIIIGDGDDFDDLRDKSYELGISDSVSFPGYIDNPYPYMARSDVFALSSAWEGFGVVLVEAMSCGTPVVSTNCKSGPSEILEDGTYGPLVPVGDAQGLSSAIIEMINEPTCSQLLRERAEDFSIKNVSQYEDILFGQ